MATGCSEVVRSSTNGKSQKEHFSTSSSVRAPHCEHIRITGPFCAAEVPVAELFDATTGVSGGERAGGGGRSLIRQPREGRRILMR